MLESFYPYSAYVAILAFIPLFLTPALLNDLMHEDKEKDVKASLLSRVLLGFAAFDPIGCIGLLIFPLIPLFDLKRIVRHWPSVKWVFSIWLFSLVLLIVSIWTIWATGMNRSYMP